MKLHLAAAIRSSSEYIQAWFKHIVCSDWNIQNCNTGYFSTPVYRLVQEEAKHEDISALGKYILGNTISKFTIKSSDYQKFTFVWRKVA